MSCFGTLCPKVLLAAVHPSRHFLFTGKGGLSTATTYLKKHKISKGETIAQSLEDRFECGQKLDKTQSSELISSYECDHMTADAEFLRTIQTCGGSLSNLVKSCRRWWSYNKTRGAQVYILLPALFCLGHFVPKGNVDY